MTRLDEFKNRFQPGRTYRRAEVAAWSKSVDRDLRTLVRQGALKKLRGGIYFRPQQSVFGEVPVDDHERVRSFLKDDRFLLTSPNAYNALGLGMTQLYNKQWVYNHKRHGDFDLGGRAYAFRVKHHFPLGTPTPEFLLVDLVNNVDELAEDREVVLRKVRERAATMDSNRLGQAVGEYGNASAQRFFAGALANAA